MITKNEVKYIQSLAHQKNRNETGVFLAEGVKLVEDLIKFCPGNIEKLFALEDYIPVLESFGVSAPIIKISSDELFRISHLQTPNRVVALLRQFDFNIPAKDTHQWLLALDGIQDPGNMGTLLRLSDWFGIENILCSMDCVDIYNPKVVQASMGSIARVGVHYAELSHWLKDYTRPIIGAVMNGVELNKFAFPGSGIIVIGNEGKGISEKILALLSDHITIPNFGSAESLNAAMATGIILWELRR